MDSPTLLIPKFYFVDLDIYNIYIYIYIYIEINQLSYMYFVELLVSYGYDTTIFSYKMITKHKHIISFQLDFR